MDEFVVLKGGLFLECNNTDVYKVSLKQSCVLNFFVPE